MRRNQNDSPLLWLLPVPVVLWLAALLATEYKAGMTVFTLMGRFSWLMEHPLSVRWTPYTLKFMLGALIAYGFAVALCCSTRENRRPGEEHGSAKWGSAKRLNAKYRDKDPRNNTILTQNVRMSLNGKMHRRNLLQIVIGGSGAGKTRFFVKPNLMEANCSFLVTDPKGETLRAVAPLLLQKGYVIKVFDLIDPARSDSFNAFAYIKDDKDVMKLVNNFIKNTTPKGAQQNDPFWERSEIALDTALILYLIHEAPPEEQNFEMLIYMIENGGAKEDDDDYQSPLDLLFEALEEDDPSHIAVREYKIYKQAAGKTAKSILISAAVRLSAFILPEIQNITAKDDMELDKMGERKQAVFAIIPDNDSTFNYIVGMLYTCAFQSLYYQADKVHQGALPVPVRMMMDEFCNVSLPDDFGKLQATMRSRNIMSTIVLQNISALKALFKDDWEGLIGNADTLLYLGGNEVSTFKYISELLGKETLDTAVMVHCAAATLISAVTGLIGGTTLLLALAIIIVIAAVASSPFGLFFAAERNAPDTVSVAEAVTQVNIAYNTKLEELQTGNYDSIQIHGQAPDWPEVLAVFAAKTAGADDGVDVATLDADRVSRLTAVFWDMTEITTEVETIEHSGSGDDDGWTEYILHITITPKTADDMRTAYAFTRYQNDALDELLADRVALASLASSLTITNADAAEVLQNLPDDLSPERRAVVQNALTLYGKVSYFWGGKSLVLGWDSRWGQLRQVTAAGSSTTGTYRPYGLDCSGFVDWAFYNATGGSYIIGHGGGATMQHSYCTDISWQDARPGDLVFYPDNSHVGIVCGRDETGKLLVIHCASGANNVVITGTSGFASVARPDYYGE